VELELIDSQALLEWIANNYKSFGATLEIVTDKSQEGSQFVRGFGGVGGRFILRLNNENMKKGLPMSYFNLIFR
jgi:peptide chain release factor subunit 1